MSEAAAGIFFAPELISLADQVLSKLPEIFYGAHLRIEKDFQDAFGVVRACKRSLVCIKASCPCAEIILITAAIDGSIC